jgi:hypothetical protein
MKGVAYQQNYQPNGTASANASYTDPLADGTACKRDIPLMKPRVRDRPDQEPR